MSENPYEAPKYSLASETSSSPFGDIVYHCTDSRRLSFGEFWRIARNLLEFCLAAALKLLRIRLPVTFAFADTDAARPVDPQQLPDSAVRLLQPAADQAAQCGLRFVCAFELPTLGAAESAALAYMSDDGAILMPMVYVRIWNVQVVTEQLTYSFLSRLSDGRVLATTGARQQMNPPPEYLAEYWPERPMAEVLARHRARLVEQTASVVGAATPTQAFQEMRNYERRAMEFHRARGVYVAATPQQLELLARCSQLPIPVRRPKSTAYQGLEFICLTALMACLFFANSALGGVGRVTVILCGLGALVAVVGLVLIWIHRFLQNRRNRAT